MATSLAPLAAEEPGGGPRSGGMPYQKLLDTDSREVPEVLRWESARELPVTRVPIDRYTSQEIHDLEMEKLWPKVWQVACREEVIPEPGDHTIYEIGDKSVVVVRGHDSQIRAFHNVCLHRGRRLKDGNGRSESIRCPFHGWAWNLDGSLREVPCRWDFPQVKPQSYSLPEVQVGNWGGFVFINFDPDAAPLSEYLGDLSRHFERWPLEKRYSEAHVAHLMPCNWKVVQEAFSEAYHVIATHPQILAGIGDSNSQYDAWDNFSRAISPNVAPSPHLKEKPSEQEILDSYLGTSLDEPSQLEVGDKTAREVFAQMIRLGLQGSVPSVQQLSDAELCDNFYYTVFPNFHPWGAYNKINYRFRPYENDPQRSIMEVWMLAPYRGRRPEPAKFHWLDVDEPWSNAPELGTLANIFDQDTFNLGKVQRGLRAAEHTHVTLGSYQETKIRHFHSLLEKYLSA